MNRRASPGSAASAGSASPSAGGFAPSRVCSANTDAASAKGTATASASAGTATPESFTAPPTSAVTNAPDRPARSIGARSYASCSPPAPARPGRCSTSSTNKNPATTTGISVRLPNVCSIAVNLRSSQGSESPSTSCPKNRPMCVCRAGGRR